MGSTRAPLICIEMTNERSAITMATETLKLFSTFFLFFLKVPICDDAHRSLDRVLTEGSAHLFFSFCEKECCCPPWV